ERQAQPGGHLLLVFGVLAGQAEDVPGAGRAEVLEMVAEVTRLGRAATRAGDGVPAGRELDAGAAGHRIEVDDGAAGSERAKVDRFASGARQRERGQRRAGQVIGGAVIHWYRKIVGQRCEVDHTSTLTAAIFVSGYEETAGHDAWIHRDVRLAR